MLSKMVVTSTISGYDIQNEGYRVVLFFYASYYSVRVLLLWMNRRLKLQSSNSPVLGTVAIVLIIMHCKLALVFDPLDQTINFS